MVFKSSHFDFCPPKNAATEFHSSLFMKFLHCWGKQFDDTVSREAVSQLFGEVQTQIILAAEASLSKKLSSSS